MKKSKPTRIPRTYEAKIEDTITRAQKTVQITHDRIKETKSMLEITRKMIDEVKKKQKA